MAKIIDLSAIASVLEAAHQKAAALPYEVAFEVDMEKSILIARGTQRLHGGTWVNGSTTGRLLSEVFAEPDEAFAYMFGFLQASFRTER